MKQSFGARPARSCLLSMHWIAVNHKRDGAVSVSVAGKICRPTGGTTIELPGPPIYVIDQSSAGTSERFPTHRLETARFRGFDSGPRSSETTHEKQLPPLRTQA